VCPAEQYDAVKEAIERPVSFVRITGFAGGNLCNSGLRHFTGDGEEHGLSFVRTIVEFDAHGAETPLAIAALSENIF